jgi:uncharacterized membrane protein
LGLPGTAAAQIALLWGGILLAAFVIGIPMLIAVGVWLLIDAFRIPTLVEADANAKRTRIANEVSLTTRGE